MISFVHINCTVSTGVCDMNIVDVSPFGVYPPKSGGSTRIHRLNMELSKNHKVFSLSQGIRKFELKYPLSSWISKFNDNYEEYRFVNLPLTAISYLLDIFIKFPPVFSGNILEISKPNILNKKLMCADVIQVEHPWQFGYIYKNKPKRTPIVLVAHNVEIDLLKQSRSSDSLLKTKILQSCKNKEKYAVEKADAIFAMSPEDKSKLVNIYNIDKKKIYIIPNGVNLSEFSPSTAKEKEKIKKTLGLTNKNVVLFTGYKHGPNFRAVEEILRISENFRKSDVVFLVAGRIGDSFKNKSNVIFTGYVDDISPYFKVADIAINPMISGSGTNLKMLDYLASGIPVISTAFGARGLEVEDQENVLISNIEEFPKWINNLLENDKLCNKLKINGRKLVEEKYDWKKIAEKQVGIYKDLVNI